MTSTLSTSFDQFIFRNWTNRFGRGAHCPSITLMADLHIILTLQLIKYYSLSLSNPVSGLWLLKKKSLWNTSK